MYARKHCVTQRRPEIAKSSAGVQLFHYLWHLREPNGIVTVQKSLFLSSQCLRYSQSLVSQYQERLKCAVFIHVINLMTSAISDGLTFVCFDTLQWNAPHFYVALS